MTLSQLFQNYREADVVLPGAGRPTHDRLKTYNAENMEDERIG